MTTLWRFGWRELRRTKTRTAILALVFTVLATALGGGYLCEASLDLTRETWSKQLHLADLEVRFVPASISEMPPLDELRAIPGVRAVVRRFISLGHVEREGAEPVPVLVQYIEPAGHPPVNDVAVLRGGWLAPGHPDRALVDRSFAAAHRIDIGDVVVVNPHRFATRFVVAGVGLSAEHLSATANPDDLVPEKGSLGVIYASREALDRTFPDQLYNDLVVELAPGTDRAAATTAVLHVLSGEDRAGRRPLEIERVVRKEETFGYRFLDITLAGSRSITPVTALVIALMAAIVAFTSMHRVVAERRREIGCLLSLGFSPPAVAACFLALGAVPGALGALLGVPGAIAFAGSLTSRIAAGSGFPDPMASHEPRWLVLAAAAPLVLGLLSALPQAIVIARLSPAAALRGDTEVCFVGLPPFLERLLAGSTAARYGARNVFRRVRLSLATAIVIALSVALPAGLLTAVTSWYGWSVAEASRLPWDATASFQVPLREAQVDELLRDKGVVSWEGYIQGYAPLRRGNGTVEETRLRGVPRASDLAPLALVAGRRFTSDDADEVILNAAFAAKAPPRLGEIVTVAVRHGEERSLRVVGLVSDAGVSTALLPRSTAERLFGLEGKVSGAYLRYGTPKAAGRSAEAPLPAASVAAAPKADVLERIDLDEPAEAKAARAARPVPTSGRDVRSALLDEELVTGVRVRSDNARATLAFIGTLNVILTPFIALSGGLAFFFLLGVLGFLLRERETEYATLRSLGYATREIGQVVLTEIAILSTLGGAISVGLWVLIVHALRAPMNETWFPIPNDFRAVDFASCSAPTLLFLLFAAFPAVRAIMQLNISAALRGRAIG